MLQKGGPGWMYPIPEDAELEPEDHPIASWRARKYLTRNRVFRRVCIILDLVAQASIAGAWALWIYDQTAGAGLADPNLLGLASIIVLVTRRCTTLSSKGLLI